MINELSTLGLYIPLAQGNAFLEDVTRYIWPSYRRNSLAIGGDGVATFSFQDDDSVLETWFDNRLMCHVEEKFEGVAAYFGYIHAMRLSYNGVVLSKSMDGIYNKIAVKYRTSSAGSDTVTAFSSNATSIALYGTKELIAEAKDKNGNAVYLSSTSATQYRDNLLEQLAFPRQKRESISRPTGQIGTLDVEIRGYAPTMDWILLKNTSTSDDDADDEITDALSGANFVRSGTIATNTFQVKEEVDYVGAWQRVKTVTNLGDSSGNVWLVGCYRSQVLNYQQADLTNVQYFVDVRGRFYPYGIYNKAGEYVPAPLVQPGGVAFVRDIMPGRKVESTLLDDPRAGFVDMVEYSIDGAVLKNADSQDLTYVALQQALEEKIGTRPNIRPYQQQSLTRPPLYGR